MPEISLFYGIRVTMYYNDHMPPHFHAEYNGHKALVDIIIIQVIRGYLRINNYDDIGMVIRFIRMN